MNMYAALLVVALVGSASAFNGRMDTLCKDRDVNLERISSFLPFIEAAKRGGESSCSFGAKQSVLDLEPIIKSENICSIETVGKITQYYDKYVSKKGQYYRDLPRQVKEVFMAVGFLVNRQCETALEHDLEKATKERISADDQKLMRDFNSKANHLAEIVLKHEPKLQSLFIVADLSGATKNGQMMPVSDTISVSPRTKFIFDEIKRTCRNKFKPIYDKLIIPQVIMENVGFDYDGGYTGQWKADFRRRLIYKDWFKVVFICESAIHQKVIVDPRAQEGNRQKVTVLDKNDLAELKRETGLSFDEPESNETPQEYVINEKLEHDVDLKSSAMREMTGSFQRKHMNAKGARNSLIMKIFFEAQQVLHVDQVRFGRSNSASRAQRASPVDTRDNWVADILGNLGKAFGLAISFPLAPAILASGWVTLAISMFLVNIAGIDNAIAAHRYNQQH